MPILDIESPIYILGMEVDGSAKNMAAFHNLANIAKVWFAVERAHTLSQAQFDTVQVGVNRHVTRLMQVLA